MKEKIQLDFDDTTVDFLGASNSFSAGFLDYCSKKLKIKLEKKDVTSYMLATQFNVSDDEIIEALRGFYVTNSFSNLPLIPGVKEYVDEVVSKGCEVYVVTARPEDYTRDQTFKNIEKHFNPDTIKDVIFTRKDMTNSTEQSFSKQEISKKLGITKVIDDRSEVIDESVKLGIKSRLHNQPWNEQYNLPNNSLRFYSWYLLSR